MSALAVRAVGVCTPLGRTPDELWARIAAGEDGFGPPARLDLPGLGSPPASAFDGATVRALCAAAEQDDPALAYGVLAGRAALAGATPAERAETVLVCATSAGAADLHERYDRLRVDDPERATRLRHRGAFATFGRTLADALGVELATTVSTACASGGHALGLAADLLRAGEARRVLVLGADSVHPWLFAGFRSVGVLADAPCSPFGQRFGMSLGEGGGALWLGPDEGEPLGYLLGWGGSCDAYHPTSPDPRGEGMARSLASALADAALTPDEVGAYNAHATGTEANDPAETFAVRAVLGDRVPVSATKSQLGHTQGAAGVLEAIVALWAMRRQALPPSLRSQPPRRVAPADTVSSERARPARYRVALSHSAAFGGTNVTVALGLDPRRTAPAEPCAVYATGVGATGPFGAWPGHAAWPGAAPPDPPGARGRISRADPVSAALGRALAHALADAGVDGPADGVGLVVGMADGPQASIRRFVDSCGDQGLGRASAAAFGRMVLNAPAGAAATASQVRGTNLTVWSGHGAGAHAVLVGARLLRQHADLDAVVAAGADEVGHLSRDRAAHDPLPGAPIEAGGALVLSRRPGHARLAGVAWGRQDELEAVARRASAGARPDRVVVSLARGRSVADSSGLASGASLELDGATVVDLDAALGHAPAAAGALASVAAVEWIRRGEADTVLVVCCGPDSGSVALAWTR